MRPHVKWYTRVPTEEELLSRENGTSHKDFHNTKKRAWSLVHILLLISVATCFLAISSIIGMRVIGLRPLASAQNTCRERYTKSVHSCGNSTAEARALGCEFDILAAAWVPEECQDRELAEEFRAAGPWHYFADPWGRVELREEELSERIGIENNYWSSRRWHIVHCSFQWRKMHRSIARGARIEDDLLDYEHTKHCGMMFLMEEPLDELATEITVEFLSC